MGQWDDALENAERFLASVEQGSPHYQTPAAYCFRGLIRLGRGDPEAAAACRETCTASAGIGTASLRNLHNAPKRPNSRDVGEISMRTMLISPSVRVRGGIWRVAQVPGRPRNPRLAGASARVLRCAHPQLLGGFGCCGSGASFGGGSVEPSRRMTGPTGTGWPSG